MANILSFRYFLCGFVADSEIHCCALDSVYPRCCNGSVPYNI